MLNIFKLNISYIPIGSATFSFTISQFLYCFIETIEFNIKVNCNTSFDLYQDYTSKWNYLHTEVIGYSIIVQYEKDYQFIFTGELIGSSSSILLKLFKFGHYRITVFPVIGFSSDHTFLRHSDVIFHQRIHFNTTNHGETDPNNLTIKNNGKKLKIFFATLISMLGYTTSFL